MRESISTEHEIPLAAMRDLPDGDLVARIRKGEQRAFEPVMRRYNRRMFRAARGILLSDAEAEEAVQEAYVRAYLHLDDFRGPHGLGAWLTRIAVNEALMRQRRLVTAAGSMATQTYDDETVQDEAMAGGQRTYTTPEQHTANAQLGAVLEQCIDCLPATFRIAFLLRDVEQLSVAETAASLDIPEATVKTRVHRARHLLRQALSKKLDRATRDAFPFAGRRCDAVVAAVFHRLSGAASGGSHSH